MRGEFIAARAEIEAVLAKHPSDRDFGPGGTSRIRSSEPGGRGRRLDGVA
jgi:hypothetical protein